MENTALAFLVLLSFALAAAAKPTVCVVYFNGIGCPHCANADPAVLGELPAKYNGSLVVIDYEVYKHEGNKQVMIDYMTNYGVQSGVPQIVLGRNKTLVGDKPILGSLEKTVSELAAEGTPCPLVSGGRRFELLDLNTLPGSPQIWVGDRLLARTGGESVDDELLKSALSCDGGVGVEGGFVRSAGGSVEVSGGKIEFNNSGALGGWKLYWNEDYCRPAGHAVSGARVRRLMKFLPTGVIALGAILLAFITLRERSLAK
jgi:glutaredoxin